MKVITFLFLDNNAPDVVITSNPVNFQACENGDRAEFSLNVDPGGYASCTVFDAKGLNSLSLSSLKSEYEMPFTNLFGS